MNTVYTVYVYVSGNQTVYGVYSTLSKAESEVYRLKVSGYVSEVEETTVQ